MVCAATLALVVLACAALASNPSLHHLLHSDADEEGHDCVIELFAHSQVVAADPVIAFILGDSRIIESPLVSPAVVLARDEHRLLPGRAPPLRPS